MKLNKAVGLTLEVVERDTLRVPEPQYVLVTEALAVEEREGERVGDTEKVEDTVGVFEPLVDTLGEVVLVKQVVGELDCVEVTLTVREVVKVPDIVPQPEAEALLD